MPVRLDFNVEQIDSVAMVGNEAVSRRDLMSPYVWRTDEGLYAMLVRAVPRLGETGDTGTIWCATSTDGLRFTATDKPVLTPGPGPEDIGGCEDPTPVFQSDGSVVIYYTGLDATRTHGEMLYAVGPSIDRLEKKGVAMPHTPSQGNLKEATVDRTKAGGWRMFFEFARDEASLVGLAVSDDIAGPWTNEREPFSPRTDSWDTWHLSTGPLLTNASITTGIERSGEDCRCVLLPRESWPSLNDARGLAVSYRCRAPSPRSAGTTFIPKIDRLLATSAGGVARDMMINRCGSRARARYGA